jgi:uncharacterized DUF497 family protein
MKTLNWDNWKNVKLLIERGVSFDNVEEAIRNGNLLDVIENTSKKHKGQSVLVVRINNYIYAVPYVENEREIFLITIMPSRKLNKRYGS